MDIVVHEQFHAPLSTTIDELLRDHGWMPDNLANLLTSSDMIDVDGPCGRVSVWNACAWHRDQETRFYFVSAVDGGRKHIIAGPYPTRAEAEDRVAAVRTYACDQDGRAHFMGWGTASSREPLETPLGAF